MAVDVDETLADLVAATCVESESQKSQLTSHEQTSETSRRVYLPGVTL